jgi:hypothetical protein
VTIFGLALYDGHRPNIAQTRSTNCEAVMKDEPSSKIFQIFSDMWQKSMNKKDFHDAITSGISSYLILREKKNEQIARGALNLIHVAIGALLQADGVVTTAASCSFCGRSGSDIRLGAGPDAHICVDCVEIFHRELNGKPHS